MSTTTTPSTTPAPAPSVDLSKVEDGSKIEAKAAGIIAESASAIGKIASGVASSVVKIKTMRLALAIFWGYVVLSVVDQKGDHPFDLRGQYEVMNRVEDLLRTDGKLKDDAAAEAFSTAVKASYRNRVRVAIFQTRALASLTADQLAKVKMGAADRDWMKAVELLPESIQDGLPGNLGASFAPVAEWSKDAKVAMAAQYRQAGIDVPPEYGGPEKPKRNRAETLDKAENVLEHIGQGFSAEAFSAKLDQEGGVSAAAASLMLLRGVSVVCLTIAEASEVHDRPKVEETLRRISATISATLDPKREGTEAIVSVAFDPERDK